MSQSIEVFSRMQNPIEAVNAMGEWIAKSGFGGCEKVEQGKVVALACMCKQMDPFDFFQTYDIVEGKLRKKALACLAEFRTNHKGKHRWIASGDDGKAATIELTLDGESIKSTFTIDQAKLQGLVRDKSNWVKSVGNMLRARAITNGIAMICPEILAGCVDGEDDEPAIAAPKPLFAVVDKPAPATQPATVVDAQVVVEQEPPQDPKRALLKQAFDAIGDSNMRNALTWMMARGWITNNDINTLTEERARKIINNPPGFIKTVTPVAQA